MIISRTPFRVSFFGGGTDYPAWFETEKGAVLATTIDKYCYVTCRWLPPFFHHRHRIAYSRVEHVEKIDEIIHPTVREGLRFLEIEAGVEIHHDGDLPARSGLGSSSAFTVGLLNALYALKGQRIGKVRLAREAIHVERDLAEAEVGSQDQVSSAHGGLNRIEFSSGGSVAVSPIPLPEERRYSLESHLMLFFTGLTRNASEMARSQVENTHHNRVPLRMLRGMVDEGISILSGNGQLTDFGMLLHEAWQLKKSLAERISNDQLDSVYAAARRAGAVGGKLLGAGGGGFFLFFADPDRQAAIEAAIAPLLRVPFRFESHGTQIIFYDEPSRFEV